MLDDELAGPVYLVSSDHELPDLLADLHGQVDIRLRGVISAAKARIKTVFYPVPDVPVSKFVLTMKGGKKGLLVNSRDLCAQPSFSFINFKAQNGKQSEEEEAAATGARLSPSQQEGQGVADGQGVVAIENGPAAYAAEEPGRDLERQRACAAQEEELR